MLWGLIQVCIRFAALIANLAAIAGIFLFLTEVLGLHAEIAAVILAILVLSEGWTVYSYVRYRAGRRDEMFNLIRAAIDSNVPLEAAVRAYLHERPALRTSYVSQGIIALLITPVVPCAIFVWMWCYWQRFDRRVALFAECLDHGTPLDEAVADVPQILSGEARLAIRIGALTGRMRESLARMEPYRSQSVWLDVLPRLIYPFVVLVCFASFLLVSSRGILPRQAKAFAEFKIELPEPTQKLFQFSDKLESHGNEFVLGVVALILSGLALSVSSRLRWHLPLFGVMYRRAVQGRVLRTVSLLVDSDVPAPEAFEFLAGSEELPGVARTRLRRAVRTLTGGGSLPEALTRHNLAPRSLAPLLQSAQASGTLAWSLRELGEHLTAAAQRSLVRLSLVVAPTILVVVSLGIAYVAVSTFLPLIAVLERLSEL